MELLWIVTVIFSLVFCPVRGTLELNLNDTSIFDQINEELLHDQTENEITTKPEHGWILRSNGIYARKDLGTPNKTILLPNGEDIESWRAPYNIPKRFPLYLTGYDDDERPVWVVELGRWDVKGIFVEGHKYEFQLYALQAVHSIIKSVYDRSIPGMSVDGACILVDYDKLTMEQISFLPGVLFGVNLGKEYNDLMIRHMEEIIVINANYVAETLFHMLKPILGSSFMNIQMYGNKKSVWMPHLFRRIPAEYIPPWYGGPNRDFKPIKVIG